MSTTGRAVLDVRGYFPPRNVLGAEIEGQHLDGKEHENDHDKQEKERTSLFFCRSCPHLHCGFD